MFRIFLTSVLAVVTSANFPSFSALVKNAGYVAEKHNVLTEDGWRLSMIRIYKEGIFDKEPAISKNSTSISANTSSKNETMRT